MSTDWSGDDYFEVSDLQRTMARQSLDGLDFSGADRILDIGCGDGFITRSIAASAPNAFVAGLDPSPLMIATAHRASPTDAPGPRFVIGDAVRLPYGRHFDAVVSFNALHWVRDQQRALAEIATVLRTTGWALVQMVCESPRDSIEDVMQQHTVDPRWAPHFEGFTAPYHHVHPDQFAELVKRAGLELSNCTVTDREWDFGSRDALAAWCAVGTTAWTEHLDPADRNIFVDQVVDAYEGVAGRPGLFRFTQLRALMTRV